MKNLLPAIHLWNEDCIRGMAERLDGNSVDLIVTSIPFEELFTYSGKVEDVGNNGSTIDIRAGRFAANLRFMIAQAFRVLRPGANFCCHIQQLLAYKNQHGFMGRRDFRGSMIDVFGAGGFQFIGEFAIQKDPQAMAQRLNLHSLQFKTGYARHAGNLAPCVNDYVLIFHKPGEAEFPVRCIRHKKNATGWISSDDWVRDAHGIWTDIDEIDVLDGGRHAREHDQEKHVCPLQLTVIRRLILLYSNPITIQPNVMVLDPFMGIGSTAWVALEQNRNAVGFELKESYHQSSLKNIEKKRRSLAQAANKEVILF
jgi:DNA modification methylase